MVDSRSLVPGQKVCLAADCVEQRLKYFNEPFPESKLAYAGQVMTVTEVELDQSIHSLDNRTITTHDTISVAESELFWFAHELDYAAEPPDEECVDADSFDGFISSLQ